MENTHLNPSPFDSLLQREIDLTRALLDLLEREYTALAGNEPPDELSNQEKLALVSKLQDATRARIGYSASRNLSLADPGRDALPTAESGADRRYNQLMVLARACQEKNRQVGRLLNRRTQFVSGLLDSLNPVNRSSRSIVYGADGRTSRDDRGDLLNLART